MLRSSACFLKRVDLSNNMCEYEVNLLTYEKVIEENKTLMQIVNDATRTV